MPQGTEGTAHPGPGEVHRRVFECYRESRFEDALELIDPDVVDHREGAHVDHRGRDAWRRKWERGRADSMFRNVSLTIEQNVVSGDTSVNRYTVRGTHTASGRRYEVLSLDMVRIRDGRIIEHCALLDTDAMHDQLGL